MPLSGNLNAILKVVYLVCRYLREDWNAVRVMPDYIITSRFGRDRRGSTTVIFGLSIFMLLSMAGAAIDFARWHDAHVANKAAVDSALLAAARRMQVDPDDVEGAIATAMTYYKAKIEQTPGITDDSVNFVVAENASTIRAQGSAYLKTTLLRAIGIDRLQVAIPATAAFPKGSGSNVEVSMLLDFTGSMCDDGQGPCSSSTNIDALKAAAKEFVNILISDTPTAQTTRVALVPFSTRVRISSGSDGVMMKKLTGLDQYWSGYYDDCLSSSGGGSTGEAESTWTCSAYQPTAVSNWELMPCVTERAAGEDKGPDSVVDYTDEAPGPGRWMNAHAGDRFPLSQDGTATPYNPDPPAQTAADAYRQWNYDPGAGWCSGDLSPNNVIVPLTGDKLLLKNRIDAFEAGGATAGTVATQMGWYLLSPKWSGVWSGSAQPGPYSDLAAKNANGAPVLRKIAVMMTDGVFNSYRTRKEQDPVKVSNHALAVCAAMKASGVEIYTVGFEINQLQAADATTASNLLRNCATDQGHYYSPSTANGLKAAFRDIALKVNPVHLTQ